MTLKRIVAIGAVIPALLTAGIVGAEQGRLAMQIDGKGPVVVLESGMGEARANWQSVVKALAPCFTVVTYDRYGIGESPPPADPDAPVLAADVADTLLSVLRARDLAGPYILVGHSLGGLYVQALARNHPEAAAGLVLVDASSPIEPEGVFVSMVPPKPGTIEAVEDAGVADSMVALRDGPSCRRYRLWSLPRPIMATRKSAKPCGKRYRRLPPRYHRGGAWSSSIPAISCKRSGQKS